MLQKLIEGARLSAMSAYPLRFRGFSNADNGPFVNQAGPYGSPPDLCFPASFGPFSYFVNRSSVKLSRLQLGIKAVQKGALRR